MNILLVMNFFRVCVCAVHVPLFCSVGLLWHYQLWIFLVSNSFSLWVSMRENPYKIPFKNLSCGVIIIGRFWDETFSMHCSQCAWSYNEQIHSKAPTKSNGELSNTHIWQNKWKLKFDSIWLCDRCRNLSASEAHFTFESISVSFTGSNSLASLKI